jgi:hypothetical protein
LAVVPMPGQRSCKPLAGIPLSTRQGQQSLAAPAQGATAVTRHFATVIPLILF